MTQAHPLHWPDGLPRTERRVTSQFKTSLAGALDNVRKSLEPIDLINKAIND